MCNERNNGLTFWQAIFVFLVAFAGFASALELGFIRPDYLRTLERSFQEYESQFKRPTGFQNVCGRALTLVDHAPLVQYDRAFLIEAANEAREYEKKIPHLMKLIADYRTHRRAEQATDE